MRRDFGHTMRQKRDALVQYNISSDALHFERGALSILISAAICLFFWVFGKTWPAKKMSIKNDQNEHRTVSTVPNIDRFLISECLNDN